MRLMLVMAAVRCTRSLMFSLSTFSRCGRVEIGRKSVTAERCAHTSVNMLSEDLRTLDPHQVKLLDEMCILVDENDKAIGSKSKKECHLMENIKKGMLHRAFSVFLFNTNGELLIQQRSDAKITFPGYFTNTCCSHPLHTPDEIEEKDALGVKKAALRRLNTELGISPSQILVSDFHYVTRLQYTFPCHGLWGEREIDYLLVLQKDVDLSPNANEIKSFHYVRRKDLPDFMDSVTKRGERITPWFKLIVDKFLYDLWENLGDLEKMKDHNTIHRWD